MYRPATIAFLFTALLAIAGCQTAAAVSSADRECALDQGLEFLCGPRSVEDLVRFPGTDMLIGSSGIDQDGTPGQLLLIDTDARSFTPLDPEMTGTASREFAACVGPPDMAKFAPHGLGLGPNLDGQQLLYVVNHGGREAIEIFEIDAQGAAIGARWAGCVELPAGATGNGVSPLMGGGFVATKFYDTGLGGMLEQMTADEKTGLAYRWSPEHGFSVIPGSEASGDNGIEVSADGQWIFVALWPEKRILRLSAQGEGTPTSIALSFMPDNIRRAPDGAMLITGHAANIEELSACYAAHCFIDWAVARLDPDTLELTSVIERSGTAAFNGATTAVRVGSKLWLGTYAGDRLAIAPVPQ